MKLGLIEFPSDLFTYDTTSKMFVAEASDMGNRHLQPMYNDSADRGFSIKSSTDGSVVDYALSEILKKEGEIVVWIFEPIHESIRKYPNCKGTTVHVLND